ncbi:hypothetical protein OESDEN_08844 [Oesophagostomum dentatum]|uniref:Peptidase A2 domain-containing protein n=1 Tax=Oesophagostomum dentatum TaxID=61180 RepID=A0A0B1T7C7_OESDE|nr:hypothetical protein OESDEN_08844 [Oesophagostomum dentatum]
MPSPARFMITRTKYSRTLLYVFFDTGAQKSFISCKKSKDLGLPIHRSTNFKVSGFGGKTEKLTCNEVTLTLKDGASGKLIKGVSLHTKSPLTSSMNTAKLRPADRRFIKKRMIKIAQPSLEETTITPDILLGQDLIDVFLLRDQMCTVLPSGLVLTSSVFGYAISGRASYRRQTGGTSEHASKNMIVIATPIMAYPDLEHGMLLLSASSSFGISKVPAKFCHSFKYCRFDNSMYTVETSGAITVRSRTPAESKVDYSRVLLNFLHRT